VILRSQIPRANGSSASCRTVSPFTDLLRTKTSTTRPACPAARGPHLGHHRLDCSTSSSAVRDRDDVPAQARVGVGLDQAVATADPLDEDPQARKSSRTGLPVSPLAASIR